MKHRLPKPKSARKSEHRSSDDQPELIADGHAVAPAAPESQMRPADPGLNQPTEARQAGVETGPVSSPGKEAAPQNLSAAKPDAKPSTADLKALAESTESKTVPVEAAPTDLKSAGPSENPAKAIEASATTQEKLSEAPSLGHPPATDDATDAAEHAPVDHAPFLIQTRGLVKQYGGRRVVNGVDIHVRAGEVVGLLGKNGAGKTTTFYMIVGLVTPTEGHVYMGAEDVTRMPMYRRARRGVGYLPQEESIFRKLTVEENLLAILETLSMTEEERDTRCDELLKDFGLEHVRENVAITLSGGEKRRVTIARALVTSPSLLLLDEPFSGVDPMAVHDIQEIILNLKNRGLGVLITDHNVRETLSVVDRAYIIDEGRVLSEGSREFLLNDPIAREIYLGHRFSM